MICETVGPWKSDSLLLFFGFLGQTALAAVMSDAGRVKALALVGFDIAAFFLVMVVPSPEKLKEFLWNTS